MINIVTYTSPKGGQSSQSSGGSGSGSGYGNSTYNNSQLEEKLNALIAQINDWFYFDATNNAVACRYDFYSEGGVSAMGGQVQPAPVTYDYIQDGLVFHLDGKNKGTTQDAWTDTVGGVVFTADSSGITSIANGWEIDNQSSNHTLRNSTDTLDWGRETSTIEIVYETSSTRAQIMFNSATSSAICIGMRGTDNGQAFNFSNVPNASKNKSFASPISIRGLHTASLNVNGGMIDIFNELTPTTANTYFGKGTYNDIGGRDTNNTYSYSGNIYDIRIYNRLLTHDEMSFNQMVDNERYNLNITNS